MKPVGMPWSRFVRKRFELWPLMGVVTVALTGVTAIIVWSCVKKDFIVRRGHYPWDRRDLLRLPFGRNLVAVADEKYEPLKELDQIYKEMDNREQDLMRRRRKTTEDQCT